MISREFLLKRRSFPLRILLDLAIVIVSIWLAFVLQYSEWWPAAVQKFWWLFPAATLLALPIFYSAGFYLVRPIYISTKAFYVIIAAVSLYILLLGAGVMALGYEDIPLTVFAICWFITFTAVAGSRVLLRSMLQWLVKSGQVPEKVAIYGAGEVGAELAEALQAGHEFIPVAFVDGKHELHGSEILGLKVYSTDDLARLTKKYGISQVLLALPSANRSRRQEIVDILTHLNIPVRTVPDLMDIVAGRARVEDIREIEIEEILGRDPVPPDERLLSACITGKSVMVTGAGGSIGSELCRQIVKLQPSNIVLYEAGEYSLYSIDKELRRLVNDIDANSVQVVPILGSVTNRDRLELVIKTYDVQTLYHAAAYKHVPIVESNPIDGIRNNVFGTWHTAAVALKANIENFTLISTDKAVRPSNIMGATKRMAELVVQALAEKTISTRFSIVRFGNVLGSSGSVVPLFKQQILNGGPVTITHPEMTRYFMTIPEAAQLVIQASSMGERGDVFVLDMGEPVRIADMARQMIYLCGLTVRDENNPEGDISIEAIELRSGEKLYEELLIGDNVTNTEHPRIMRASEVKLPWEQLTKSLGRLEKACKSYDVDIVRKILEECVAGYNPQCGIVDPIWRFKQLTRPADREIVPESQLSVQ